MGNDPVNRIDPSGLDGEPIRTSGGFYVYPRMQLADDPELRRRLESPPTQDLLRERRSARPPWEIWEQRNLSEVERRLLDAYPYQQAGLPTDQELIEAGRSLAETAGRQFSAQEYAQALAFVRATEREQIRRILEARQREYEQRYRIEKVYSGPTAEWERRLDQGQYMNAAFGPGGMVWEAISLGRAAVRVPPTPRYPVTPPDFGRPPVVQNPRPPGY